MQVMDLLIMQLSPNTYHFSPWSKYFPQHPLLKKERKKETNKQISWLLAHKQTIPTEQTVGEIGANHWD
jgi:hypothetical protein